MRFARIERVIMVLFVGILMLSMFPFSVSTVGVDVSEELGENSLPLDVYIVSLADVGNHRASNHSMVVEGAIQATKVNSFGVFLDWNNVVNVNVSITAHIISDWEAYQMLIEWGNNVIVVNTHDEYLPVPAGYTKEEWVDKVADFMLNRWGTWAHLSGYPLYHVWHQNGTKEEWGEQGFKKLMSHIGRGNATCYPPPDPRPGDTEDSAVFWADYLINWWLRYGNHTHIIGSFHYANLGYPINIEYFKESVVEGIYKFGDYATGGVLRFASNQSAFNFGIYVHLGAWRFFDINGREFTEWNDLAMGFIATAAAIWEDIGYATYQVYGTFSGSTPQDAIEVARFFGRTVGLDRAEELLQKAINAYSAHNYKMAVTYAKQAKLAAENATQPNYLPQIIAGTTLATLTIGVGAYYKIHNKNKKKET